ncbi:AAA-like domain-containing protein [Crocosphaera sp.]|uniref:AAA-like domain-containing protein n=1 Tax=Crocosphaera sp. TaxID=2729996 RepID=UPI003F21978C
MNIPKILVVDDELDLERLIRQKFRRKLKRQELDFVFAHNGREALEYIEVHGDIDIVLTDIYMPEMDGLTLLTKIQEIDPIIKAIIISAYGDLDNIRAAMNYGAFDFLTKPIDFKDLEITTTKTLNHVKQMKDAFAQEKAAREAQEKSLNELKKEIEKRKKVEEALRNNEKQLTQFLAAIPVGIFIINAQNKCPYYTNNQAQEIFGKQLLTDVPYDELIKIYQPYCLHSGQKYPLEKLPIQRALQGEKPTVSDIEIRHQEERIPLEISAQPIYDEKGNISYVIAAFKDITQRKEAEAERIHFTQELAKKNLDLQQAKDQLSYYNATLEKKVFERTQELTETLEILKATQAELMIENALLRSLENEKNYDYQVGGSLPIDAPSYVFRSADRYVYKALKSGQFCYILNARQMGKSSLRVQIMKRLQAEKFACVAMDLSEIGNRKLTIQQWYAGFIYILLSGLELLDAVDLKEWLEQHDFLSPVQWLGEVIQKIILPNISKNIVVFIDEVDSVLSLDFPMDDFFIFLRSCYNKRADKADYKRLTFALLGVASPSQLLEDKQRTPFNIGQVIYLKGFQFHEAQPLLQGLKSKVNHPQAVLKAVLYWTNGQPFLTQKICHLIHNSCAEIPEDQENLWVDQLVRSQIIENWETQDDPEHLKTIRDRISQSSLDKKQLLKRYQAILHSSHYPISDDEEIRELILSGLVIKKEQNLTVHNPIYQAIFNDAWIEYMMNK